MILRHHLQTQQPLHKYSTFAIGGKSAYFSVAHDVERLQELLAFCQREKLPWIVIGKGSNTLFSDEGFEGLVILNRIDHCRYEGSTLSVGAGYSFSLLGRQTARRQLSGLEFACGIPGSVGGAIFMNAGASGQETAHSLDSVDFLSEEGVLHRLSAKELLFGYRTSSFQSMRGVIVSATFRLTPSQEAKKRQEEILRYRLATQPYDQPSVGCIFRNPSLSCAGALIEQAGLKGYRIGGVQVSTKHANFIVNLGSGRAADVLALIASVKELVWQRTGQQLDEEVRLVM